MSVINTNVKALAAQGSLSNVNKALGTSMERLSTGLRINSAADDAAGLAITNRMTSQIRGYAVAIRNSNDGISMAQTAEGAMGQVTSMLQRMRELSVQAANGAMSDSDRGNIQQEVSQLKAQIDDVANKTNHNNINLLDGSAGKIVLQTGTNAGDTMTIGFGSVKTKDIGLGSRAALSSAGGLTTGVADTASAEHAEGARAMHLAAIAHTHAARAAGRRPVRLGRAPLRGPAAQAVLRRGDPRRFHGVRRDPGGAQRPDDVRLPVRPTVRGGAPVHRGHGRPPRRSRPPGVVAYPMGRETRDPARQVDDGHRRAADHPPAPARPGAAPVDPASPGRPSAVGLHPRLSRRPHLEGRPQGGESLGTERLRPEVPGLAERGRRDRGPRPQPNRRTPHDVPAPPRHGGGRPARDGKPLRERQRARAQRGRQRAVLLVVRGRPRRRAGRRDRPPETRGGPEDGHAAGRV